MFYSEEDDFWVTDRARICTTYIRTWFVVDLVSIIPFEVIGMIMDSDDISKLKVLLCRAKIAAVHLGRSERKRVIAGYSREALSTYVLSEPCQRRRPLH